MKSKSGDKKLVINIETENNKLIVKVIDNGVGRKEAPMTAGTGTGTKVLNQYISILNQYNHEKIILEYTNLVSKTGVSVGTIAQLTIPLSLKFNLNTHDQTKNHHHR